MTELNITRSFIRLTQWTPPEGVRFRIVVEPAYGDYRLGVILSVDDDHAETIELGDPADETTLDELSKLAHVLLDSAWDSRVSLGPDWAADLGLDLARLGADE